MNDTCLPFVSLERYATGVATGPERAEVESHAGACAPCRLVLTSIGLAFEPGSVEEEALVAWVASSRPVSALLADLGIVAGSQPEPVPGWWQAVPRLGAGRGRTRAGWFVAAGGFAAAVAASLLFFLLPGAAGVELPHRALQGRPALLGSHAPFRALRGSGQPTDWEALEAQAIARKEQAATVAILLARGEPGDWSRAGRLIEQLRDPGIRANESGVLLLAQGHPDRALQHFDEALRVDGELLPALFNRALALEALGRRDEARSAWQVYLAGAGASEDAGWLEEARSHLER